MVFFQTLKDHMATQPALSSGDKIITEVKVVKANAFRTLIHKERLLDCFDTGDSTRVHGGGCLLAGMYQ